MKLYYKRDYKKAGIYCIKNLVNNKVYIGKSINIYNRLLQHKHLLDKKSLDENRYLIAAWHKYNSDNFQYFVLEYTEADDSLLKERELYWIILYDACNRDKGYNLRMDTSTMCIVSQDTRELQSKNRKERYRNNPQLRINLGINSSNFWKNNPDIKKTMAEKVSKASTKYCIYQYDKHTKKLIKKWDRVIEIIHANPTYKVHNIYAVCSGEKPSMYGYIWVKVLITEDIVRSSEKSENLED